MSDKEPSVSVSGLTVAFNGIDVTHTIDLDLYPGRITALVGESGSGKSVTAMALPRLEPIGAEVRGNASLRYDGSSVDLLSDKAPISLIRGGLIGIIFQEPSTAFNPVFTVGGQIVEMLRKHAGRKMHKTECRDCVLKQLREVGISDAERIYESYPHQLSGGQLQRAMIAMAIINRPRVLIADEPTTALDVTTQKGILALLKELASTLSLAILLITHDMGVVRMAAQDVYVMQHGSIVEHGPVNDVFRHPQQEYTKVLLSAVPRFHVGNRPVVLDEKDEAAEDSRSVVARLDDVSVEYSRGKKAVSGISFSLKKGSTDALVGESGAGKSTIAKVLSGQLDPTGGDVFLEDESLPSLRGVKRRHALSKLGYVFQDSGSALNPRKTVAWSISEPLRVAGCFSQKERQAKVYGMLDRVELSHEIASRYPHQLSGGQRQRVGIARSLVLHPDLLIADEPTSSLDVTVQRHILCLLHDLQQEYGFACLFITHDLGIVQEVANEIIVMKEGRIVEQGAMESVLFHPRDEYTNALLEASPKFDF